MTIDITRDLFINKAAGHHAGENKMALSDGAKSVHKTTVSWFEFLFDTTGDLLKKHLGDTSAGLLYYICYCCCFSI